MALEVRVLGGIGLTVDGAPIALPRRVQLLLALLVAHRVDGIDPEALIDELYAGTPPTTAPAALRVHLAKLRDALEPDRVRGASTRIARTHGRWWLHLDPMESDVGRFESGAAEGTQVLVDGDPALAATLFEAAQAQWHGEPYPGLDSPFVGAERERLARVRREIDRRYFGVLLDLGRTEEAIARLSAGREEDPFDEHLVVLEARAHYQLGGPAQALTVLRGFRDELADQLGLDPSAVIDRTEAALLRNDPALLPRLTQSTEGEPAARGSAGGPGSRLLDGLSEDAQALAEALAVLGTGLPVAQTIEVAGPEAVEELLVAGIAETVLTRVRLADPVAAEAIRDQLGTVGVRRVLLGLVNHPGSISPLALLGAVEGTATAALPAGDLARLRIRAGEEALGQGDPARAVEALSGVESVHVDDEWRARWELCQGRALLARGDTAPARGHLARASQLFRSLGDAGAVLGSLESYVGLLAPEAAEGLVIDGHAAWLLGRDDVGPDQRVLIRELQSMIPGPDTFGARIEALLSECDDAGTPLAGLVSLMARWRLSFENGRPAGERLVIAESAVSLADQLGEPTRLVRALRNQIDDLLASADRRQYQQRLERLRALATTTSHAEGRWWCEVMDVGIALRERPEVSAIHEATFAVHAAWPQIPDWWRDDMVLLHEAIAMYSCGRRRELLAEMAKLHRGANPLEIEDHVLELMVLSLRAEVGQAGAEPVTPAEVSAAIESVLAARPGWRRPAELYLLGRAAIYTRVADPRLLDALTPYAETWVCVGTGAATLGPMSAVLAGLHAVAGDAGTAQRYAAEARMRCTDLAATVWSTDCENLMAAATSPGWPERSLG